MAAGVGAIEDGMSPAIRSLALVIGTEYWSESVPRLGTDSAGQEGVHQALMSCDISEGQHSTAH